MTPGRKLSFAPVVDERTRVLILGSLPGEVSLARAQYYGHPRNQFWRLMAEVVGEAMPDAYGARLARLGAAGVGLWDVVRSAHRSGSLDAAIRRHEPNALADMAATLPALAAIAFNGKTAAAIGRAALEGKTKAALVSLPSSSPAYTLSFASKAAVWSTLRAFL
jgi:TDG/mug DNA glycosylase family protein